MQCNHVHHSSYLKNYYSVVLDASAILVFCLFQRIIDVLKIDTEGAEFAAFSAIDGNILSRVKQLPMEIHLSEEPSITSLHQAFSIFRLLEDHGFRLNTLSNYMYLQISGKHKALCVSNQVPDKSSELSVSRSIIYTF